MKKGFTFVETMIVLAIIGLLIAIAIPAFVKARNKSRLQALGLESIGEYPNVFIYNPETKEVVEVDDGNTEILKVIGKINMPIDNFEKLSTSDQWDAIYKGGGTKSISPKELPKKSSKSLISPDDYVWDGQTAYISDPNCTQQPNLIVFNGVPYQKVDEVDAGKLQDDPKYKYIENSFNELGGKR